jgi:hypothetical protein
MLIARDGKVTTVEGIVDLAKIKKWFGSQMIETR